MRGRLISSLAVGMVVVLVAACDPAARLSASPVAATTGTPGPTLAASASAAAARSPATTDDGPGPALAALQWRKASIQIERTSTLFDVAATAVGWVAVGTRLNLPGPDASFAPGDNPLDHLNSGVIWISSDGLEWTQLPDGPEFDGSMIVRVLGAGGEALAFGRSGVCLPDACSGLPPNGGTIVWSSVDGSHWVRHERTGLENGAIGGVVTTDRGLVAVGYVADRQHKPDTDQFGDPTDAAIWRSDDGLTWVEVAGLPVADALTSVAVDGDRLVAVGSNNLDTTVFWTSTDGGRTWVEASTRGDFCCEGVAFGGGRIVSVGRRDATGDQGNGVAFSGVVDSSDLQAHSWSTSSPAELHGVRPVGVWWLGSEFVVFGFRNHADQDGMAVDDAPIALASADLVHWRTAPLPPEWAGMAPAAVAEGGARTVVAVRPMDSLNAPPDTAPATIWLAR